MSTTTKDTHRESHTHTRSINFEGHEPEAYTGYTHKGKQWIPSHAWAEWSHGQPIEQITVTGHILKKDGTPGAQRGDQRYATPASRTWDTKYGRKAPDWLLELFADSQHTTEATK